jgi:hypothetical protein
MTSVAATIELPVRAPALATDPSVFEGRHDALQLARLAVREIVHAADGNVDGS